MLEILLTFCCRENNYEGKISLQNRMDAILSERDFLKPLMLWKIRLVHYSYNWWRAGFEWGHAEEYMWVSCLTSAFNRRQSDNIFEHWMFNISLTILRICTTALTCSLCFSCAYLNGHFLHYLNFSTVTLSRPHFCGVLALDMSVYWTVDKKICTYFILFSFIHHICSSVIGYRNL